MSTPTSLENWRDCILAILEEKQASDIRCLDVGATFALASYFVIASAQSYRHLWALCQYIEKACKEQKRAYLSQGKQDGTRWIVMDVDGIFIHLFLEEGRSYYQLEELWREEKNPQANPQLPSGVQ